MFEQLLEQLLGQPLEGFVSERNSVVFRNLGAESLTAFSRQNAGMSDFFDSFASGPGDAFGSSFSQLCAAGPLDSTSRPTFP